MHPSRVISRAILGALILVALVPATALGISRDAVLARGKVWVDQKTPYSQTRWATVQGALIPTSTPAATAMKTGYRTDCSGYVSMCFGLTDSRNAPLSLTTRTFYPSRLTMISKAALLPGDVMLKVGSHVVLFVRWADPAQKAFIAYEERGTAYGCVETTRTFSEMNGWGYHSYRYKLIDDFYPDVQQSIYGPTLFDAAVAASRVAFPDTSTVTVRSLVVANGDAWTGNLGAAALAGAARGPLLLTGKSSLPATAEATIARLKPAEVFVIGGPSIVAPAVTDRIASLGIKVTRIQGKDRDIAVARAARTAVTMARKDSRKVDVAYLVGSEGFAEGVSASPIAASTARPILLTRRNAVPAATLDVLKKTGIKRVYVLGSTKVISSSVMQALRKRGITVTRKSGKDRYATALSMAHHGAGVGGSGLTWAGLGVTSGTELGGALSWGVAQGQSGSLLLFTPGTKLAPGVAAEIAGQRSGIGKVRVYGGYNVIGLSVRTSIAKIMRAK